MQEAQVGCLVLIARAVHYHREFTFTTTMFKVRVLVLVTLTEVFVLVVLKILTRTTRCLDSVADVFELL